MLVVLSNELDQQADVLRGRHELPHAEGGAAAGEKREPKREIAHRREFKGMCGLVFFFYCDL